MVEDSDTAANSESRSQPLPRRNTLEDEVQESEIQIALLQGEIQGAKQKAVFCLYGICTILGLAALATYWSSFHLKELLDVNLHNPYGYLFFGFILAGFVGLPTLIYFGQQLISAQTSIPLLHADINSWTIKKRITSQFATHFDKPSYFDNLVRINIEHLAAYYAFVKMHTDKSYKLVMRVCLFGFCLLLVGIGVGFIKISNVPLISYLAIASGVVTEIIASIFFCLYTRTIRQMKSYHDSLLAGQHILLSLKLLEDIADENEKANIVGQMLAYLIHEQSVSSYGGKEYSSSRPAVIKRQK
jgi:hypothetical protein